ncbi:hypothetical protein SKAU_G00204330 [Synaphobranchus kaupii]|uniref:Uncharacterized protein n=1 Tax=Synaphobranchus kaupii TaxID=118154 RepID=A0A9Q1IXL3_SYNKA|nr:hypothetical protein SKAU_G00204330 [Synaphobranchus kaupii]
MSQTNAEIEMRPLENGGNVGGREKPLHTELWAPCHHAHPATVSSNHVVALRGRLDAGRQDEPGPPRKTLGFSPASQIAEPWKQIAPDTSIGGRFAPLSPLLLPLGGAVSDPRSDNKKTTRSCDRCSPGRCTRKTAPAFPPAQKTGADKTTKLAGQRRGEAEKKGLSPTLRRSSQM